MFATGTFNSNSSKCFAVPINNALRLAKEQSGRRARLWIFLCRYLCAGRICILCARNGRGPSGNGGAASDRAVAHKAR